MCFLRVQSPSEHTYSSTHTKHWVLLQLDYLVQSIDICFHQLHLTFSSSLNRQILILCVHD
jgi:hypothetical protein